MLPVARSAALVYALMAALPQNAIAGDATIGFGTIDNFKLGSRLSTVLPLLEQPIRKTDQQPGGHCFYASPKSDQRFTLMFVGDVLTRIDVMQPGPRTAAGVAVGDPVSRVREAYGAAIKDAPDFYDDSERYLTMSSGDGKYAIRFSTSAGKIASIISGTTTSVEYVEGCL